MKKIIIASLLILNVLIAGQLFTATASAAVSDNCDGSSSILGFPTWYKYLDVREVNGSCEVVGPTTPNSEGREVFNWQNNIGLILLAIVELMLRIAALVSVVFVIYGGFRYILSQGNPDSATSARKTIINSIIGLIIALLATAVVNFVARTFAR